MRMRVNFKAFMVVDLWLGLVLLLVLCMDYQWYKLVSRSGFQIKAKIRIYFLMYCGAFCAVEPNLTRSKLRFEITLR